jgi:hypothetical protein
MVCDELLELPLLDIAVRLAPGYEVEFIIASCTDAGANEPGIPEEMSDLARMCSE